MVNNYIMKMALPLAGWFVVEYMLRNYAVSHLEFGLLLFPMMIGTLVIVYRILLYLRRTMLSDMMLGIQVWTFGVQLAFFAGLVEALFIWLYNQYIAPTALADTMQQTLASYQMLQAQLAETGAMPGMADWISQMIDELQKAPVPSAIESAIQALSNEMTSAFFYMIPLAFMLRKKPRTE